MRLTHPAPPPASRHRSPGRLAALGTAALLLAASGPPAAAQPATSVAYPAGATATRFTGSAFDTCTAPSLTAMRAWRASPYRAVGVYVSGVNRTCAQPRLTASWVRSVSAAGFRLLPIHKGLQPPCGARARDAKISRTPAKAREQGTAAAQDAVARGRALGMRPGSAFYNDIEHYAQTDTGCRTAVLSYLSSWTRELHRTGHLSGVYMNLGQGAKQLSDAYTSTRYARPDALWVARYDRVASLTGWRGVPATRWAAHQRAKQYRGTHDERHGGVTISIDGNRVDAPVATVAHTYRVTGAGPLLVRSGPSPAYTVLRSHAAGASLAVVCQTPGPAVGRTRVWNLLAGGGYVTDHQVTTPSATGYSAPLPRCSHPYQTTEPGGGLAERTGPGVSYPVRARLPQGSLAWVTCQRTGSDVGGTRVWNRLANGRYATDRHVATPGTTGFSAPLPRC
ncbi:glycoside hydrolase domain-containing protein [Streptomyces yaizuensis]|uniref:DUF1906 domain-containing protein n=1 Tax=Streptomyces yaizuensis TaxID=2989713 RepID=A0ABQ5NUV9_9ACTN|nr:glycoside hydrolase domain-containing protein [Streptomyces sp. YSPA8]GLF94042.1 DUF1906 domain-containing protein [Streptomyces sp. YSPA8]